MEESEKKAKKVAKKLLRRPNLSKKILLVQVRTAQVGSDEDCTTLATFLGLLRRLTSCSSNLPQVATSTKCFADAEVAPACGSSAPNSVNGKAIYNEL